MTANHYSLLRRGNERRTACSQWVAASAASPASPITCPTCRSRLADKAAREASAAAQAEEGQIRDFHLATEQQFRRLLEPAA